MKKTSGFRMNTTILFTVCICIIGLVTFSFKPAKPLKILLITGGCCHNYPFQTEVLKSCLPASKKVLWTVVNNGDTGTRAQLSMYDNKNWAKGFDLVVHNECYADTQDSAYIKKITNAHYRGANAVVIHCAMHSYRAATMNDWRAFLGVTTRRHDHQSRYPVTVVRSEHPVMKDFPLTWISPKDELYIIEKIWPSAIVLATSASERNGKIHPVAWTNQYGKARVFGTTFGHSDEMFKDSLFVKMISQGMMWAMGK